MNKLVKKAGVLTLIVTGLLVSQPVIQVTQAQEVNEFQQVYMENVILMVTVGTVIRTSFCLKNGC